MSQDKNLHSLKAEFRYKGKADRGFNTVSELINAKEDEKLARLLRYHGGEGVYGEELKKRFEFDMLLEFYNLLLIGALAGYIPPEFDEEMREEMKLILSHRAVSNYYTHYYPYKLTEYSLAYVRSGKWVEATPSNISLNAFNNFISLNRMLKRDKELERFTNMLDHVSYGDDNIDEVNAILSSYSRLNAAITSKQKSADEQAVWGFFKYSAFLSQLKEVLQSVEEYPLLQSGMWLYHGYFFDRMNAKMKSFFNLAFENIREAISSPQTFSSIAYEVYGEKVPEDFDENELKEYASAIVGASKNDVEFILEKHWPEPLKLYFKDSL
jgi:hypothetical protein